MHRLVILLACLAALGPALSVDARDLPKNFRVIVEYIEAPHEIVTELMVSEHADSGPRLHARMRTLVKENKARIMETSIVTTRSRIKAAAAAHMEHIYPIAFQPIYWIGCGGRNPPRPKGPPRPRPLEFVCFDTRNVGTTLEIEPFNLSDQGSLELRLTHGITNLLRYETWFDLEDRWGDSSIRQPIYETLETKSLLTLLDGKFSFVNLLTPTNMDGGPDTTRKIMLFVRADIMTIEHPDTWKP